MLVQYEGKKEGKIGKKEKYDKKFKLKSNKIIIKK